MGGGNKGGMMETSIRSNSAGAQRVDVDVGERNDTVKTAVQRIGPKQNDKDRESLPSSSGGGGRKEGMTNEDMKTYRTTFGERGDEGPTMTWKPSPTSTVQSRQQPCATRTDTCMYVYMTFRTERRNKFEACEPGATAK